MRPSLASTSGTVVPSSKRSVPLFAGLVIVARMVTFVPTSAAMSPPSSMCSAGMPVYAGKRRSTARLLSAGRSDTDSRNVDDRTPFAST